MPAKKLIIPKSVLRQRSKRITKQKAVTKLKKDVKALKAAMGQQIGVHDTERDVSALTTTLADYNPSTQGSLFALAQGDSDENREGNKIRALNFDIRGALSTTHVGDQYVRIIAVQWGDAPGVAGDILKYTFSTLGVDGMAVINSPYARDPSQPYKLLYDQVFKLSKTNDNGAAPHTKRFRINVKLGKGRNKDGVEMTYAGTVQSNPILNGIRIFMCYGQVGTTSPAPTFQLKTRERFVK